MEDLIRVSSSCCDITSWHASAYHRAGKTVWNYFVILDFGRYQLRMMRVQKILLLFLPFIPLSKSYCSTPGTDSFSYSILCFGHCCHQHLRLEPKINWTPNCGAGLGQTNIKATVVFTSIAVHFCAAKHDLSEGVMGRPSWNFCVCWFHQGDPSAFDLLAWNSSVAMIRIDLFNS